MLIILPLRVSLQYGIKRRPLIRAAFKKGRFVPYTEYAKDFVDADGKPLQTVFVMESCIESAEQIMRTVGAGGARLSRRSGGSMMAKFKNLEFNASEDDFLSIKTAPESHTFLELPRVGQGIILLNKTSGDLPYNMHFGAVVAWSAGKAVISHMFQQVKSPREKPLEVLTINTVQDFASHTFGADCDKYAIGLLTLKK